jgi:hypothetical protein
VTDTLSAAPPSASATAPSMRSRDARGATLSRTTTPAASARA